jgi:hypothetical protein
MDAAKDCILVSESTHAHAKRSIEFDEPTTIKVIHKHNVQPRTFNIPVTRSNVQHTRSNIERAACYHARRNGSDHTADYRRFEARSS